VDKRFVKPIIVNDSQSPPPPDTLTVTTNDKRSFSRKDVVRKWSVRKIRKRPQKSKHSATSSNDIPEEKAPDDANEKSVIVFGDTDNDEALDTTLFVSSDEDSATSEDSK
jgi:hypothetical protein